MSDATKKLEAKRPVLTQRMTLHVDGGHKFSELHYEILADGERTGITIHKRTNGSPQYKYTALEVHYGEECLDVLSAKPGEMMRWIKQRAAIKALEAK